METGTWFWYQVRVIALLPDSDVPRRFRKGFENNMCGIIGYTGVAPAVPILLNGLSTLEYRGYDSAGIAVQQNGIRIVKTKGRLSLLEEKLKEAALPNTAHCGIGHTRWATHGEPSDRNSHPHATENLALVHNGIIENYADIAAFLTEKGYTFLSETDTETAAKLVDYYYLLTHSAKEAIFRATEQLRGSFAFGIIFRDLPDAIFAIRKDSPLVVAVTGDGGIIASDVPAVLAHSKDYFRLDEGVLAELMPGTVHFYTRDGKEVREKSEHVDWNVEEAQKGGYPHFMLKEIFEEPDAIRRTVEPRLREGLPYFEVPALDGAEIGRFEAIHIVACGTAMHAGLIGKNVIERLARVPVNVEVASEFRYRDPILGKKDLVILLSQSGETADTLAALRHAKANGVYTLAIVNVIGSSVAREADSVLYTWAGPEIAVASTKAYSVQCALLYLFALKLATVRGQMTEDAVRGICAKLLTDVPDAIRKTIAMSEQIRSFAAKVKDAEHLFYIGRKVDWDLCTEGSLKLKEISYIHSEAYAAGELKHGTISLIVEGTPVIAVTTASDVCEKTISGIREVRSRGAWVLSVTTKKIADRFRIPCDGQIVLTETEELLAPFPAVTVLQLLAYHVSALKGLDVDKPRNLAKSVTVE